MRMVIIEIWERKTYANGSIGEKRVKRFTEWFTGSVELSGMTYTEKVDYAISEVSRKFSALLVSSKGKERFCKHHKGNQ